MRDALIDKYLTLIHLIVNHNTSNLVLPSKITKLRSDFLKRHDVCLMEKELLAMGSDNKSFTIKNNYQLFKQQGITYVNNLSSYIDPNISLSFSYINDKFSNDRFVWETDVLTDCINAITEHVLFAEVMFNNHEFGSPEFLALNNG